jgi:hypothetical protein
MSEERFDRLENQLTQLIQAVGTMQQNMATKQDLALLRQEVTAVEQNMATKQDLALVEQNMATKQDLALVEQNMATKQDLALVRQEIAVMEQNMATKQDLALVRQEITALQNNVNALREDVISLRHRIDSIEGAVSIVIRNTFTAHQNFVDDLNFDLTNSERKIRRLGRRVARLERQDLDD